jgi:hypothetical protein
MGLSPFGSFSYDPSRGLAEILARDSFLFGFTGRGFGFLCRSFLEVLSHLFHTCNFSTARSGPLVPVDFKLHC